MAAWAPGPVLEAEYSAPVTLTIEQAGAAAWTSEGAAAVHRAELKPMLEAEFTTTSGPVPRRTMSSTPATIACGSASPTPPARSQ